MQHIQPAHTGSTYSQHIQLAHTGSIYSQHIQTAHTGSIYRQHIQTAHTGSTYRQHIQPAHTASTYRQHIQLSPSQTANCTYNYQNVQSVTVNHTPCLLLQLTTVETSAFIHFWRRRYEFVWCTGCFISYFCLFIHLFIHSFIHPFHWHVQNATIPCRSQELLPFLSVIHHSLPPFSTN